MIDADAFVQATPREIAPHLSDAIHLWRLPWRPSQARTPLLDVLAAYLCVDASTLMLEENAHGKPRLGGTHALHFNWSHSGEFALVALARDLELGVDIEHPRTDVRALELAQRFFTTSEAAALSQCETSSRETAFLQLWCAKEAVLKAIGRGIAFGLERVEFARVRGRWEPRHFDAEAGHVAEWQVLPVTISANYIGALAWRGAARPVNAWTL